MTSKTLYEIFGEMNDTYVKEAREVRAKKKLPVWLPWTAAACFLFVLLFAGGMLSRGRSGNNRELVNLENGEQISFVKADASGEAVTQMPDIDASFRELTEEECNSLFAGLSATGQAAFAGKGRQAAGFDGKIGNVKVVISTPGLCLRDTIVVGREESTQVEGTAVTAGYFVTRPNSRGEKNVIYYASFALGNSSIYVEGGGTQAQGATVREEVASVIWRLIQNGEPDFSGILK